MRYWWVVLLLVPTLSGCLSFLDDEDNADGVQPPDLGYDPESIRITGTNTYNVTFTGFNDVPLSGIVVEPVTPDALPDGGPMEWPVVVFLHGWGFAKEQWQNLPMTDPENPTPLPLPPVDLLEEFAQDGFLAVAYDARGFGQSGGQVTVAGPAEMADLDAVITQTMERFSTNGRVGVTGTSYGGGQAFLAWATNDKVTTVVPHDGWVDLYDAILPGNVPKAEWAAMLVAIGEAGSGAQLSPMVADWVASGVLRQDLGSVEAAMDQRSVLDRLASVEKPLFVCQGMQDTLFPQVDLGWDAPGFVRAHVFQGGHDTIDRTCWDKTKDWFRFFLAGKDTGVDHWPFLETVDASGHGVVDYASRPDPVVARTYLAPGTLAAAPSDQTFTIDQRIVANPFQEPSAVWDVLGQPNLGIPEEMRQDPTAVFFDAPPVTNSEVLLGAPTMTLQLEEPNGPVPFQVAATLFHVTASGDSRIIGHAAYAAVEGEDIAPNGTVHLRFQWVKDTLEPGDYIQLKLASNDPSWYLPLLSDYSVTFTGHSTLDLPYFSTL